VFLVFKECVNNAVRHSACTRASIELLIEHHALRLVIRDNGCGFDLAQQRGGHGLTSMTTRAGKIGGQLEIDTSDRGTVVTLRSPLS
jgi:signal transduction histidine kinase